MSLATDLVATGMPPAVANTISDAVAAGSSAAATLARDLMGLGVPALRATYLAAQIKVSNTAPVEAEMMGHGVPAAVAKRLKTAIGTIAS